MVSEQLSSFNLEKHHVFNIKHYVFSSMIATKVVCSNTESIENGTLVSKKLINLDLCSSNQLPHGNYKIV